MYILSQQQIDFILSDIKSRGIEMEDLQVSLLDHICCLIESELEPDGDFESFYRKIIPRFFKKELREIEEETILLLTFKNYYAMKKTMITTGTISVVSMIFGSFFKIMHLPGANVMLLLGIALASLIFMPLMFILRTRETNSSRDKIVLGAGVIFGMLVSISTLFKVFHWPGANMMWFVSLGILFFVYIPVYFFTGIRNPETKFNTITSTVLLMLAGGLLFTLTNIRPSKQVVMNHLDAYVQHQELLKRMQANISDSTTTNSFYTEINSYCEKIKSLILQSEIGMNSVPVNYDGPENAIFFNERDLGEEFYDNGNGESGEGVRLVSKLKNVIEKFNSIHSKDQKNIIPIVHSVLNVTPDHIRVYSNLEVLNGMTQIQMFLASAAK